MNERIKELASKALDEAAPYTRSTLDYNEVERVMKQFAELIIRECCLVVDEVERADTGLLASKFIKAHFGVEE